MSIQLHRRLFNVREYHIMAECGILTEEERVELLNGEIVYKSHIGSKHASSISRINELVANNLKKKAILTCQSPIVLDDMSEPEPDFTLLKPRDDYYSNQLPEAKDVLLVIEVSDTTLDKDRDIKLPLYARSGIPEAWIVNLEKEEIEVHQEPVGDSYKYRELFRKGDSISVNILETSLEVERMIPGK